MVRRGGHLSAATKAKISASLKARAARNRGFSRSDHSKAAVAHRRAARHTPTGHAGLKQSAIHGSLAKMHELNVGRPKAANPGHRGLGSKSGNSGKKFTSIDSGSLRKKNKIVSSPSRAKINSLENKMARGNMSEDDFTRAASQLKQLKKAQASASSHKPTKSAHAAKALPTPSSPKPRKSAPTFGSATKPASSHSKLSDAQKKAKAARARARRAKK